MAKTMVEIPMGFPIYMGNPSYGNTAELVRIYQPEHSLLDKQISEPVQKYTYTLCQGISIDPNLMLMQC